MKQPAYAVSCLRQFYNKQLVAQLARQLYISKMTLKPGKLSQTKLVLVYDYRSSSVDLCMQRCKSLRKVKRKGECGFV